jgi:hypothetical protein
MPPSKHDALAPHRGAILIALQALFIMRSAAADAILFRASFIIFTFCSRNLYHLDKLKMNASKNIDLLQQNIFF